MKKLFHFQFLVVISILLVLASSCRKENKEVIEEVIEEAQSIFMITLDSNPVEYDGYAAYCNENGIESFSVSNNSDLLDDNLWTASLADNDFVIHYRKDANSELIISGAAFDIVLDGQPVTILSNDVGGNIVIEEANATQIIGAMSGEFLTTTTGEFIPYSVTFAAAVDPNRVPVFCE